ncbi:MAG TPA: rhodanese-like domain-containing protein [Candidatus Acidoferrales bacterium]|jgi:rhodanese-related sulfurtransferase|nr:rhodanese-like domain-containing protein [Candidatus Acidoferrales bacterium]
MTKWIVALFLVIGLAFCSSSALAQDDLGLPDDASMVPPPQFIKPADVLKMMNDKDTSFVLVDTQPEEAFADGHIPGAINFPWVPQVRPPISLPRDKMLVLYCPCNHDEDSIDMYKKLAEFGYLNTKVLEGGWYKWVALKYPVVGNDAANAVKEANAAAASGESGSSSAPAAASTAAPAAPADTTTASTSGPLTSGRPVGAVTPSLRVIDVTGKYKGQDTCYVCEYGTAPTVIGFFQKPSDQAADLIVKLNSLVQSNKNLKGFIVMINGPESKDWLTKLAADKGITIPMVYLAKGTSDTGMRLYKLNPSADNTILVDNNRTVFANFVNVTDNTFAQVTDASTKMLASAPAPATGNGQ